MEVAIYREPCWLLEAAELLYALVNQVPPERLTVNRPCCIPVEEVARIQSAACAGISPDDPLIKFYFQGTAVGGVSTRLSCLAISLLMVSLEVSKSDVDEMVHALCQAWHRFREEQYHITGIDGYTLDFDPAGAAAASLSQEIAALPVPVGYQMQLVEVFSGYDEHLHRMVELLRPVAERLPALMAPWIRGVQARIDQWETFFQEHSVEQFVLSCGCMQVEPCQRVEVAMRYFSPLTSPVEEQTKNHLLRIHLGIAKEPNMNGSGTPEAMKEWEYSGMRLLSSPVRMEMFRSMLARPMTAQELSQKMNMNPGSVFRDINSLYNARLLLTNVVDGRKYYRANYQALKDLANHLLQLVQEY